MSRTRPQSFKGAYSAVGLGFPSRLAQIPQAISFFSFRIFLLFLFLFLCTGSVGGRCMNWGASICVRLYCTALLPLQLIQLFYFLFFFYFFARVGLNQYQTIMACPRLLLLVESVISPKISKSTPLPSAQDEEGWKGRGNVEKEEEKKEERTKKGRKKKRKG